MTINQFILALTKLGVVLLIGGGLAKATFNYAVKVSHEQQFGLISLGQWSRQLESGGSREGKNRHHGKPPLN